jgi:hypothetical protein
VRRGTLAFTILTITMVIAVSFSLSLRTVKARPDFTVESVDHSIQPMYNGYVLVNDTITVSGQMTDSFLIGFPHEYAPYVLGGFAYDANRTNSFRVSLDVPMENRVGFYGVRIDFPQPAPQSFSVEIVLSNNVLIQDAENTTVFTLDFPGLPSLTESVAVCNVSIVLPATAEFIEGTVTSPVFSVQDLAPFAYNASTVTFYLPNDEIQKFDVKQLNRVITANEFGQITGSDTYIMTNNATKAINLLELTLPLGSSNTIVRDQFGRTMQTPVQTSQDPTRYRINLTQPVEINRTTTFSLSYDMPSKNYVESQNGNSFVVNMSQFQDVNYFVDEVSVNFVLPEGATITDFESSSSGEFYSVAKNVFQETVSIGRQGVLGLDSFNFGVAYQYSPVWLAFRPTMWVWALALLGTAIFLVWQRPKAAVTVAPPTVGMKMRPDFIRSFVESYEEKMKITFELDSLESKVQKGRIPRRRYKVQKKTLEARLNTLSRSLSEASERMRSAGGHYADLMRQLEVAETDINDVEANVKTIEVRHSRGEVSLEAYRRLTADYQHRKEKAETTIDGILLRLREEIR